MCSIFGVITNGQPESLIIRNDIEDLIKASISRGRDGLGVRFTHGDHSMHPQRIVSVGKQTSLGRLVKVGRITSHAGAIGSFTMIGNARAEPTTEWVVDKSEWDQQPYHLDGWTIVHNGTIANDKDLRTYALQTRIDSAAIVEQLAECTLSADEMCLSDFNYLYSVFHEVIRKLKGSYAILATHDSFPGCVFAACNYRPIWIGQTDTGMYFASQEDMLPTRAIKKMLKPYSCSVVTATDVQNEVDLIPNKQTQRALVVASGGMDSTVAAQMCKSNGLDVTLINFQYGCRAETNELKAIRKIAEVMEVPLVEFPIPIYDKKDSPLFDQDATIAGGEEGAEFAHEWVPARNLVMLSVATAYAEANGFDYIVLGNNLEEAGAYPDNEPEFINRFNQVLPFAVGDGKRVEVLMPVGNLMKHEIVATGLRLGAPLEHTWSCYRNGDLHCGTCGPCMMRRTAFNINNAQEVIKYESEE